MKTEHQINQRLKVEKTQKDVCFSNEDYVGFNKAVGAINALKWVVGGEDSNSEIPNLNNPKNTDNSSTFQNGTNSIKQEEV